MKNKGVILLLTFAIGVIAIIFLSKTHDQPRKKAATGLEAPLFELKDTEGRTWRLSDLRGKVVLLNIWASWCDSCKQENPSIQNLINAEKGNDRLIFVSVLYKDNPAKAMEYMKANGFTFPVLIDDKNVAGMYGITGVPETFIIDKKGTIKEKIVGPIQWDSPDVRAAIARLANE
ncbi:MAG: TlpA family protein disulfide reductase [Nitrospirae bacterium]|nr:TlpA family protein disulfide reductase [Nitrospirota bacterium]